MKRFAWAVLVIVCAFVGSSIGDRCEDETSASCPPVCHVSCLDGCSVAPVNVETPVLAALERGAEPASRLEATPLELAFPPDLSPPRA